MEKRAYDVVSPLNSEIVIRVIPGHFATRHSHVNYCVDMTAVKSQLNAAKAAARVFAERFAGTPVDTIISLDRMKMVGAFMAEELNRSQLNGGQNIAVITPEIDKDKLILRDNFLGYVNTKRVLLLTASASTGKDVRSVVEGIRYYGGEPVGAATVFGSEFTCPVPVVRIFNSDVIPDYKSFGSTDCPMCKAGIKVDAVINSYGYSKIV